MNELTEYDAPNTEMTIDELAFEANEYERRSTKGIQWVIIYKINSGLRLLAIQSRLGSRKFDPWLRVSDNFISGRTEAYKNMALARAKDSIRSHVERIECVSDAFELIGKYIRVPITAIQTENPESLPSACPSIYCEYCEYEGPPGRSINLCPECGAVLYPQTPETIDRNWLDLQRGYIPEALRETPESPPSADGASMPSSGPPSLANEGGGSPAPTEAEQAIKDRRLKDDEKAEFESGLGGEFQEQYLCFGDCGNYFYAEALHAINGNRFCRICRQQLPDAAGDQAADASGTAPPLYETTLFDEPPPEPNILPDTNGTLPGSNGQAVRTEPQAKTERDPYDEMLFLANEVFPHLPGIEALHTYGIYGNLMRFIELFNEIHQVKT